MLETANSDQPLSQKTNADVFFQVFNVLVYIGVISKMFLLSVLLIEAVVKWVKFSHKQKWLVVTTMVFAFFLVSNMVLICTDFVYCSVWVCSALDSHLLVRSRMEQHFANGHVRSGSQNFCRDYPLSKEDLQHQQVGGASAYSCEHCFVFRINLQPLQIRVLQKGLSKLSRSACN